MCDLANQDSCTFTPSSRALNLDYGRDIGTVANVVTSVVVGDDFVCAGFTHGNVT